MTKVVDLVFENTAHARGIDLYKRGANIALANMLHYCMPSMCGNAATDAYLRAFVDLYRRPSKDALANYLRAAADLRAAGATSEIESELRTLADPRLVPIWFSDTSSTTMEPAIPALYEQITRWVAKGIGRFGVIHHTSKPILSSEEIFDIARASEQEEIKHVGYDRRSHPFPLQFSTIQHADSRDHPQLQLCDLLAGLVNHYAKLRFSAKADELTQEFQDVLLPKELIDGLIPTSEVTPEALGTDSSEGNNAVDAYAERAHVARHGSKRKS